MLVAAAIAGGCSRAEPADRRPAAWARAAESHLDAYLSSWYAGDVDELVAFFDPDVELTLWDHQTGTAAVARSLRTWLPYAGLDVGRDRTYLSADSAVVLGPATAALAWFLPRDDGGGPPLVGTRLLLDDTGVTAHELLWPATAELWRSLVLHDVGPALDRLVTAATAIPPAWPGGGRALVAQRYAAGARRIDSIHGVRAIGRPAIVEDGRRWRTARVRSATLVLDGAVHPAVLATRERWAPDEHRVWAGFVVTGTDGCDRRLLVESRLDDAGLVVEEVLRWDLASLRACGRLDGQPLPSGWWDRVRTPVPRSPVRTGQVVTTAGTVIAVYNAEAAQRRLVEWAVHTVESAGLTLPPVAAFVFPPSKECRFDAAAVLDGATGAEIHLCYDPEQVCADDRCTQLDLTARRSALHELGHLWESANLDDQAREAFLDIRGLESWSDRTIDWSLRGEEHAAEIFAWGLMDELVPLSRLDRTSCAELSAAFRMLTGLEPRPRPGCPTGPSSPST